MGEFEKIKEELKARLKEISDTTAAEELWRSYFGRQGSITAEFKHLKDLTAKERKQVGADLNSLKYELEQLFQVRKHELNVLPSGAYLQKEWIDVTHPVRPPKGSLHPITQVVRRAEDIFNSMGFATVDGQEIEDEEHNFEALNIPAYHPARDLWDTFWLKDTNRESQIANRKSNKPLATSDKLLLRTHTSPMQVRFMRNNQPPLRIIVPGRVFRYEATDATHNFQFWQLEGLMVAEHISVANFKAVIGEFFAKFFQRKIKVRLRPGYFPFVEPGFEVDAQVGSKWLEVAGAGMVHPRVFEAVGYNPKNWSGFAFGIGMDRLALLHYGLDDVRIFYDGDVRFLKQF